MELLSGEINSLISNNNEILIEWYKFSFNTLI